eukprot:1259265-Pleurochrysis_carterae.AAC.2
MIAAANASASGCLQLALFAVLANSKCAEKPTAIASPANGEHSQVICRQRAHLHHLHLPTYSRRSNKQTATYEQSKPEKVKSALYQQIEASKTTQKEVQSMEGREMRNVSKSWQE